jgi:ribosomal protein S18 acetylase RimI-like enzyme
MATPTIKSANAEQEASIAGVLTLAFMSDPVMRWLWPNPLDYLTNYPLMVKCFGGSSAFKHNTAHYLEDWSGAAIWLPPGVEIDAEGVLAVLQSSLSQEKLEQGLAVMEQMASYHPKEPHWYLAIIGADPSCQGRGNGSALMRHALEACDRDKKFAYLESSNPRNLSFYLRHGFDLVGAIHVGDFPPVFPMVRKPR